MRFYCARGQEHFRRQLRYGQTTSKPLKYLAFAGAQYRRGRLDAETDLSGDTAGQVTRDDRLSPGHSQHGFNELRPRSLFAEVAGRPFFEGTEHDSPIRYGRDQ